jgi:beta-glucosidase
MFVMSDWGGTHSASIQQGLDMEMPGADFMNRANLATMPTAVIDNAVRRILTPMFQMGLFDTPNTNKRSANVTSEAHNDLARRLSAASTVLLKNEGQLLPLDAAGPTAPTVAVLGLADVSNCITHSDGSGSVAPARVISPLLAISNRLGGHGVTYADGSDLNQAAVLATQANVAIVFVGTTCGEGNDRDSLSLGHNGNALVETVAKANVNTIVVVATPGMVLMPWASQVSAILTNMMPGQEVRGHFDARAWSAFLYFHLFVSTNPTVSHPGRQCDRRHSVWRGESQRSPHIHHAERGE